MVQIESMCNKCKQCAIHRPEPTEPLLPLSPPENVWERIGTDLFHYNGTDYVVIFDYSSRWLDFKKLNSTNSGDVITVLRECFATHGCPQVLVSDNGPQYASDEFSQFAKSWGFQHVTSSPKHPQSNGVAERAVQTAKNMLKKNTDPFLALLAYRSAPIHNGRTPSQLLMSRILRTPVPTISKKLYPETTDWKALQEKEREYKERYRLNFNKGKRLTHLPSLNTGDQVFVRDRAEYGQIEERRNDPRSYDIRMNNGKTIRRNRKSLIHTGIDTEIQAQEPQENVQSHDVQPQTLDTPSNPLPPTPTPSTPRSRSGRLLRSTKTSDFEYS